MKYRPNLAQVSPALWVVNILIGGLLFYSVHLANMKEIGKGASPAMAIPAACMVTAIYIFSVLIAMDEKKLRTKWLITAIFGTVVCLLFYYIFNY